MRNGLDRFDGKAWRTFPIKDGSGQTWAAVLADAPDGGLFVNFRHGPLVHVKDDRLDPVLNLPKTSLGLVFPLLLTDRGLLLGGTFGLGRWQDGRYQELTAAHQPWLSELRGITRGANGDIWLLCASGAVRVSAAALDAAFTHPDLAIPHQSFDASDGLPGAERVGGRMDILAGADGRIWLAGAEGIAYLDPRRLRPPPTPPNAFIDDLKAQGVERVRGASVRLPPGASSLEIDYTAPVLSQPERARFRYRLVGFDRGWTEAGSRRQAFYTRLPPGDFRF